jgi:hypothetical protein
MLDGVSAAWPTSIALAAGFPRSGSAWLGRSQKDGLPLCRGDLQHYRFKAISARWGGAAWSLPFLDGVGRVLKVSPACVRPRLSSLAFPHPLIARRPAPAGFMK